MPMMPYTAPTIAPPPRSVMLNVVSVALPAGETVQILASDPERRYLFLQDTGTGSVTFGIDDTVEPGGGFINLDPSTTGIQGGGAEYKRVIPINEIWAISAAGTEINVVFQGMSESINFIPIPIPPVPPGALIDSDGNFLFDADGNQLIGS